MRMKRLFLLRHAEASMNAPSDRERPLTDHGLRQAEALGNTLRERDLLPDFVYCSPALRTRQTFERLNLPSPASEQPERLYNAPTGDLLSFIQSTKDDVESVMVVAHNPGMHQLVVTLADMADNKAMDRLTFGYPPATLTILECPCRQWSEIQPGMNKALDIIAAI